MSTTDVRWIETYYFPPGNDDPSDPSFDSPRWKTDHVFSLPDTPFLYLADKTPRSTTRELLRYLGDSNRFVAAHLLLGQIARGISLDPVQQFEITRNATILVSADGLKVELFPQFSADSSLTIIDAPSAKSRAYRTENF